jgi:hypothetical protein
MSGTDKPRTPKASPPNPAAWNGSSGRLFEFKFYPNSMNTVDDLIISG